ncbi:MAG: AraC family transcriptional regulator [Myxococcales bacterium]|nr:AraC family transcriptional regulator [Myxococcales bacterium]
MTDDPNAAYERRIKYVIGHICAHLDEELTLEHLAEVAGFSKYHFHRQFSAVTGFTVGELVRLTRLKRAAYQLAFDPDRSITAIALDAGFSAPESFSRAFKEAQGQTPTEFRESPLWSTWIADRPLPSPTRSDPMNPEIVEFEETRIAVLEHRGDKGALMSSVGRFIEWRKASGESPVATSRTFGLVYFDPDRMPAGEFHFDVCGELKGALSPNDAGIVEKIIPAGRCAVVRHIGSTDAIDESVRPLYAKWLPASGERLRDFPLFFHYIERMPKVAEHEQVTDIYLPLEDR